MRAVDADALMRKLEPIIEAETQIYRRESWGFAVKCRNEVEEAPTIEPERKTDCAGCKHGRFGDTACAKCVRAFTDMYEEKRDD